MGYSDHIATPVDEQGVCLLTGTLQDEDGTAIADTDLSAFVLTVHDYRTGGVINSISDTDVLNTGRGTVSSAGVYQITLAGSDNAFIGTQGSHEVHVALLEGTYTAGVVRHTHYIRVANLAKVS